MVLNARPLSPVGPLLLVIAASAWTVPTASAQCTPRWAEDFPGGDLEGGSAQAFAVFDEDGAGGNPPALFAAGWFTIAGRLDALRIAKWDGHRWFALPNWMNTTAYAMTVFDDDGPGPHAPALYVGGAFTGRVAQWDGTTWSSVGTGPNGVVHALAVYDDDGAGPHLPVLVAGGTFTTAGGAPASNVAKWNGASWTPLAGGVGSTVRAMAVFDPDGPGPALAELCIGGEFAAAGGTPASHVARWNGSTWLPLGAGIEGGVRALAVCDFDTGGPALPALYAGGDFLVAGGAAANRIARWNGTTWSPLGGGMNGVVDSLAVFDRDAAGPLAPALFVGGDFTVAGGAAAAHVASWDGDSWTALDDGLLADLPADTHTYALAEFDPDGSGPALPELFAGGTFASAGEAITRNVARWNGSEWSSLGNGMNGFVGASAVFDDDGSGPHASELYVGGDFTAAGGREANRIARWNGSSWSNVRAGMDGPVRELIVHDADGPGAVPPALYAGGSFASAGGAASGIARWDGSSWEPLGSGLTFAFLGAASMAVFDEDGAGPQKPVLFVGGGFTAAGGVVTNAIARWDGAAWSDVGGGMQGVNTVTVVAMAVFDADGPGPALPALYAAGNFDAAGGTPANGFARWDGSTWMEGAGAEFGLDIDAFAVHDEDGPGPGLPALFAGGYISVTGLPTHYIARWNGSTWSALGSGVNQDVAALAVFDADGLGPALPELYAGGIFDVAGGVPANQIAKWNGTTWAALSTGTGVPVNENASVNSLTVFDFDGAGPDPGSLYVGGVFGTAGGFASAFVARRQGCGSAVGAFCAGDGSAGPCPCGNIGGFGRGCQNSIGSGGALLLAAGHAGLTGDSWQLISSGELTGSLSIFLQGNSAIAPAAFGDGLRCVGGSLKRLYTKGASSGVAFAPAGAEPPVSVRSAERGDPLVAGALRHYQTYYRDSNPSYCAAPVGSTFNISNGVSAVWGP